MLRCSHPVDLDTDEEDVLAPVPCNAVATMQNAHGEPRCDCPGHGGIAPLTPKALDAQVRALIAERETARADARVAAMLLHGQRISMVDIEPCSPEVRYAITSSALAQVRERAVALVVGMAEAAVEADALPGLCNEVMPNLKLCRLPLDHPHDIGHVTFGDKTVHVRGWELPSPADTGFTWTKKHDGLWFDIGPGWVTKVLPRPLSTVGYSFDLAAAVSRPETCFRTMIEAMHEVLSEGATMQLGDLVRETAWRGGHHPLVAAATVLVLLERGDLQHPEGEVVDHATAVAWKSSEVTPSSEEAPPALLTTREAKLLLRVAKRHRKREATPVKSVWAVADAKALERMGLVYFLPDPEHEDRGTLTLSRAGLVRAGQTPP